MNEKRILIIDDELIIRISLQTGLEDQGYKVQTVGSVGEAKKMIGEFLPHIAFLDIRLPDCSGLDFLEEIKNQYPDIAVVMMTAFGDTKSAVRAIKSGAVEYINKPFELEEIFLIVDKTYKQLDLQSEVELYRKEKESKVMSFIGTNPNTKAFISSLEQVAKVKDTTILLRGETGTGKELAARYIHENSERKDRPFMAINCGALPANLIESELFGHEKGAFTSANKAKKGLIEWTDGGTLFLDEIGELTLPMQVKLLRFLEERKFKHIGGIHDIYVDVRIIAATHRDLEKMIEENEFRSDLFYRLNVVPIMLPPLRQRGEDILELAQYFLDKHSYQMGRPTVSVTDEVKGYLLNYPWPGNIRELNNLMERFAILQKDRLIRKEDLPKEFINPTQDEAIEAQVNIEESQSVELGEDGVSLEKIVEDLEKEYILSALNKTRWNITQASNLLGMSRYALQRRVEKYFPQT